MSGTDARSAIAENTAESLRVLLPAVPREGVEPPLADQESGVLPLDDRGSGDRGCRSPTRARPPLRTQWLSLRSRSGAVPRYTPGHHDPFAPPAGFEPASGARKARVLDP